ncbi:MAG: GNAT family N-acetyltransferase [Streptosporangiaceae bacterium]
MRETVSGDLQALRGIRLEALKTAPYAFGSTYEREAAFGEPDWLRRIARGGNFLAYLPGGGEPAGLIGGYPETADVVELVSMYVRPEARGRGVGEALVAAVFGWAQDRGAKTVHLWVTESNHHARALYQRCGFEPTGERQPLPSDPDMDEIAMARPL